MKFNIAEAKAHLSEIIQKALMGEEVIIARRDKPLVRIVPIGQESARRQPGSGKGQLLEMAGDFDAPVEDFEGYM